jgi:leucyl aminopeptidase
MNYANPDIHTARDTMDRLSIDHMLQHSRLVVGFMYELAFATL